MKKSIVQKTRIPGLGLLGAAIAILVSGCGGGGGGSASGGIGGTGSVYGSVTGTVIEAYGDHGEYFWVTSVNNNTDRHPFTMDLPAGTGFHLVMITSEGTPEQVVTPIGFQDASGTIHTRLVLTDGIRVDLGHINLPTVKSEIPAGVDNDDDGIWDVPLVLDDYSETGAKNPLRQVDADDDGVIDWDDDDHGDPEHQADDDQQDKDHDGVINVYDHDFSPSSHDQDHDGIDDDMDENPTNSHSVKR
ncbi:MAG: hypothetical protein KJ950_13925 [Proteobacteria bacterium]|nr:hypothetical protein [Pseudomonadota bacterium]MBU1686108.1 hypothetical protein [Pseudomonadota bacterium]